MDRSELHGSVAPPTNALARWAIKRWYTKLLLLPVLISAILLMSIAPSTSWWLAVVAVAVGSPALAIVFSASPHEPFGSGWHVR